MSDRTPGAQVRVDPRGPRFAAVLTTLVLVVALVTGSGWLLAAQAVVFALGAALGLRFSPYGWLYRRLVRPRLGPPQELEDERPPRFAQAVGFVFAAVGAVGYLSGATWLGVAAGALALAAAFLNAAFGYCLGCEMYLFLVRGRARLGQASR
ncbi:DUF4395 domain-containing protein [Streptacidiphilus pinicola]|uniref:DUF4395 domain-containing protein n=1 Tax=Streptacidiphilus pinicola TaxID=2219663 RepID=A0A2X0K4L3_9ACTN|nr:DUF4395 domain-containing protein [Streptacidiphilus pinicola]RAG82479.1 DUF4395 domain-containing protein [Streptacidiphilus pinicola]